MAHAGLWECRVVGCSFIITGYLVMVMSHEVMEISHVLMLISHVCICLHMLMRFHYNLEWGKYQAEPLKSYLDLWPWPVTLLQPLTLILTLTLKQGNKDVKKLFLAFDLDLWPAILTYYRLLAKVKVDPHTKNVRTQADRRTDGQTNGQTDRQTDRQMLPSTLSPCFVMLRNR